MNQVIKKTVATLITKTSLLIILLLIVACSNEPIANSGFSLPPGIAEMAVSYLLSIDVLVVTPWRALNLMMMSGA